MTIESIPLDQIKPNPWQTRQAIDAAYIAELAEDIEAHGLQQVPRGRRRDDGSVELLFGHNRLAAFQLLDQRHTLTSDVPGNPPKHAYWHAMPVEIVDATDHEIAVAAIIENSKRRDLSAIEKAKALQRYMTDFKKSQLEAGRLFGLQSQGAVSNLLRLLRLPEPVQALVHAGQLPERLARVLVPHVQANTPATIRIAKAVASVNESDRDQVMQIQMVHHFPTVAKPTPASIEPAKTATRRKPRKTHVDNRRLLIRAAAPHFAAALPDNPLMHAFIEKRGAARATQILLSAYLNGQNDIEPALTKLARQLKLRLPRGWNQSTPAQKTREGKK